MRPLDRQRDIPSCDVLVLASASPRRRELLRRAGVRFEVLPGEIDESRRGGEAPRSFARRMAREKASEVARARPGRWILAADTIVIVDDDVLGKPRDATEARAMLERLSGRTHEVVTAFVVTDASGRVVADRTVGTLVTFHDLPPRVIEDYVAGGEPFGKAGAYAIQGDGRRLVEHWQGSWSNVVGLPVEEVMAALRGRWQS